MGRLSEFSVGGLSLSLSLHFSLSLSLRFLLRRSLRFLLRPSCLVLFRCDSMLHLLICVLAGLKVDCLFRFVKEMSAERAAAIYVQQFMKIGIASRSQTDLKARLAGVSIIVNQRFGDITGRLRKSTPDGGVFDVVNRDFCHVDHPLPALELASADMIDTRRLETGEKPHSHARRRHAMRLQVGKDL